MSTSQLKELLGDLATEVEPDPRAVDAAWRSAHRQRQRRRSVTAVAAVAVLTVGAVGTVTALRTDGEPAGGPSGTGVPTTHVTATPTPSAQPDGHYRDTPVWWAPPAGAEADLEFLPSRLPETIEMSDALPAIVPGDEAIAAFSIVGPAQTLNRIVVLTDDGQLRALTLPAHVRANRDAGGNTGALFPANGSLSPDGSMLLLAQPRSVELYDFATGAWRTIHTPAWRAEGARWVASQKFWVPSFERGSVGTTYRTDANSETTDARYSAPQLAVSSQDQPFGPWADIADSVAGSYFLQGPVTGGSYDNPEAVVARVGSDTSVLAIDISSGRSKGCCPVVGWLGDDLIAFESGTRILAWRVGTGEVFRVSEITGLDPDREFLETSWAWRSL